MREWIWLGMIVVAATAGLAVLFRSFRRWQQPPPRSADQVQAEMRLFSESRLTDRL